MPTVRKTSILPASPQASESSSRCKVCSLPPDIRQELVDLRTEKGFSFYDLVEHFNSALPNRIRGGLLPDDTTEISMSGLSRHFQKYVSVDPDALYPMARERQVNLLLQSLHDRATLFQRMHDHLRSLLELATRKSAEWSRLLESEADLREEYLGTRYSQACVMRRIFELCPISQVGVRSLSLEEKQFLTQNKLIPFYMSDLASSATYIDQILESLSEDVYVTIDADVLDPSIMSAVGTPEPDGMSWRQVLDIVESVALHRHVVGFDLMEFCPAEGPGSCAFLLAKLAYKLIGCAVLREGR